MLRKFTTCAALLATVVAGLEFASAADEPDAARRGRYQRGGNSFRTGQPTGDQPGGNSAAVQNQAPQIQNQPFQGGGSPRSFSRGAGNPNTGNPNTGNPNTGNPNTGNPNTGNPNFNAQQGGDNRGQSRRFSPPSGQQNLPPNITQSGNAFQQRSNNADAGQAATGQAGDGRGTTRVYRPGTRQFKDIQPGNNPTGNNPTGNAPTGNRVYRPGTGPFGTPGNNNLGQPGTQPGNVELRNFQRGNGQPRSLPPGNNKPGGIAGDGTPGDDRGVTSNRRSFMRDNFPNNLPNTGLPKNGQPQTVFRSPASGSERWRGPGTPGQGQANRLNPDNSFVKKHDIDSKDSNHWTKQGPWQQKVLRPPTSFQPPQNVDRGDGNRGDGNRPGGGRGDGYRGDRPDWAKNNWNNWNKNHWNNWNNNWSRHGHHHHGFSNVYIFNPWWGWGGGLWGGGGWPYYGGGWGWPYGGVSFGYGYPLYTTGFYGYSYPNPANYAANYAANYSTTYAAAAQPPAASQTQLAQAQPGDPDYTARGEADFKAGKYEAAARDWQHALVDDPQNGALVMLLAQAMFAMGKYEEAAGATQAAMQMLPEDKWGVVVSNYAQLYGNTQEYTDQLKALEQARDKQPDAAALRFLLGFQFGYLGYPKHAVRELDAGMNLVPTDFGARKVRDLFAKQWPEAPPVPAAAVEAAKEFEKQAGQAPGAAPPAGQQPAQGAPAANPPGPSDAPPGTPG
ncbi:MAG: tetratricopeptide repeat protein [Pirellulales bacterium]